MASPTSCRPSPSSPPYLLLGSGCRRDVPLASNRGVRTGRQWNDPGGNQQLNKQTFSALWVGLDGDNLTDLVQAGTEQDSVNFNLFFLNLTISTYYAWTEGFCRCSSLQSR